MDNKQDFEEIENEEKIRESEKIAEYGTDIKKIVKQYSIDEAKKVREKLDKRDKRWYMFFIMMQVVFIFVLLVAFVLIFKYIGDKWAR